MIDLVSSSVFVFDRPFTDTSSARRHIGLVRIPNFLSGGEAMRKAQLIYAELVPLRVELMAHADEFDIIALSRHFDYLPLNMVVPEYRVTIEADRVRFERACR